MIEFSIKGNDYKIDKLKVKHYYQVQDLHFNESFEDKINFVSILSGCPTEDLMTLKKHEFSAIWTAVFEKFLNKKTDVLHRTIDIEGVPYGLVHLDELTVGEFADMEVISNDPMREKKLHNMMAILYRPMEGWTKGAQYYVVEKYDGKKCQARADKFLELEIDAVLGVMSFFLSITKQSISHTLDSLEKATETQEERMILGDIRWSLEQLQEDGLISSSSSPEKILSNLTWLAGSISERLSTMQPTSKTNEDKNESKLRNKLLSFVYGLKRNKQTA